MKCSRETRREVLKVLVKDLDEKLAIKGQNKVIKAAISQKRGRALAEIRELEQQIA